MKAEGLWIWLMDTSDVLRSRHRGICLAGLYRVCDIQKDVYGEKAMLKKAPYEVTDTWTRGALLASTYLLVSGK